MPLPLIPIVLIGTGALTGGGGLALGGKGALDIKKARKRLEKAKDHYEKRRRTSEATVKRTNKNLQALGKQQERALLDVVLRMGEFLRRNERQVRNSERLLVDGVDATLSQVSGLRGLDVDAITWISGALTSSAAGVGLGAGVTTLQGRSASPALEPPSAGSLVRLRRTRPSRIWEVAVSPLEVGAWRSAPPP